MNYSTCSTRNIPLQAIFAIALLFNVANAADFGVADWGMNSDQIKQLETRSNITPFGETGYLIYQVNLSGIERTYIVYQFENDQLTHGRFLFSPQNPMNAQVAVNQYQTVKGMMTNQYGPPNNDEVLMAQDDGMMALAPESYANELASDRLILKSSWRSPSAMIRHQLAWNVSKPHHQLHYSPVQPISPTANSEAF
jgi:hypothetical protein